MTTGVALNLRVAAALIGGVAVGSAGTNVMPVFIDDFAGRGGLSDAGAGLVGAAQLLATAVVTLLLAARAARGDRVRMARLGLVVTGCGAMSVALAHDPVELVVTNLVLGVGMGVVYAAATASLAAVDDADRVAAVTITGTVIVAAALIVTVPLANEQWGEGAGFVVLALCCMPGWFFVRGLPDGSAAEGTARAEAGTGVGSPAVGLLAGAALLWAFTQGTWAYASVLGREHTDLSGTWVSVILAVSSVGALAGAVAGGPAAARFGRLRSMMVFVLVEALSVAAVVVTGDPVLFTLAAFAWQTCQLAVLAQMVAAASALDPTGRMVASLSGAGALGTAAGPLAVGLILDRAGAEVLGITLAIGMTLGSLPLLRMTMAADGRAVLTADNTSAAEVPSAAGEASSR